MAEGPDPVSKSVLELEQEVTCGICHDQYQEPKIFPCCHYYCKQCILTLARRSKANQPFPCPDCREPIVLPENNPDRLPTAFFINRMKELHSRMEKAHGKVETLCEMCSGGGKATAFCRHCTHFICEECVKSHQRIKVYSRHTISTLEELKQGGAQDLHVEEIPPPKCEVHEEAKKLYCFDCSQLICRDCIVIDHAGHKYEFVKKAAPETKKKLNECLTPLKKLGSSLQQAVEKVRDAKTAVKANGQSITEEANLLFQELHKIIENRKEQLLNESAETVQQKMKNLSVQEKGISISLGTVQSLVDFVERTLENASDEEVVTMQENVLSRVEGEIEKQKRGSLSLDPVEEADIGVEVSVAESLREICLTKARLFEVEVDPLKCTVEGEGIRFAEVDKAAQITVKSYLPSGMPTKKPQKIILEVKSLVDNSVVRVQGVQRHTNVYSVEYTPKIRGRHQVTVTVNDKPIPGSPFAVLVKIPPTKLREPVRVIRGVRHPIYITFNSSEEMIVTELDILILDKSGKKLRSIKRSEHRFGELVGVTVDKEDNIYAADDKLCCLYKFSKEGKLLKKAGTKGSGQGQLNYPRGLTVVGDRLLVCDDKNNRLQVFSRELEYISQIGSKGTGTGQFDWLEDVTSDKQGNLYISHFGKNRIQILTRDGKLVRSISKKGNDLGELSRPTGMCVDDKYVYVVEHKCDHVTVFSQDGQFVTTFGIGKLVETYGIAMDSDGFIYICDYMSDKIIVV